MSPPTIEMKFNAMIHHLYDALDSAFCIEGSVGKGSRVPPRGGRTGLCACTREFRKCGIGCQVEDDCIYYEINEPTDL
jgi:hypothetical protein